MMLRTLCCLLTLVLALMLTSCGGGGGAVVPPSTGQAQVQITWPDRSRYVPPYANSIKATLTVNSQSHSLILTRPNQNQGSTGNGVFGLNLAPGPYPLTVEAYSSNNATGPVVATTTVQVDVVANQVATRNISGDLQTTIDHIVIDNQPISIEPAEQQQLVGHAEDVQNNTVLLPAGALEWSITVGSANASVTPQGLLTGIQNGSATVQLAENGANKSITAPVTIETDPENERIIFLSNRDGNNEIYSMLADGSGVVRITNDPSIDFEPALSKDRQKIAFMSNREGHVDIFVMNVDGTNPTNITSDGFNTDQYPAWSPDGSKIAFVSDRDGNSEIYVMNADGSSKTRLTFSADDEESFPTWSPDGTQIAFVSDKDDFEFDLWVMTADGSNPTNLNRVDGADLFPDWSPDGTKIVFASKRNGGNYELFTVPAAGGAATQLTFSAPGQYDFKPTYSPDGTRICFESNRNPGFDLYSMNVDGTNVVRLTNTVGFGSSDPSWSQ
jgi:Tol biopolymer transport system component